MNTEEMLKMNPNQRFTDVKLTDFFMIPDVTSEHATMPLT